jgi:hypothetical protein
VFIWVLLFLAETDNYTEEKGEVEGEKKENAAGSLLGNETATRVYPVDKIMGGLPVVFGF